MNDDRMRIGTPYKRTFKNWEHFSERLHRANSSGSMEESLQACREDEGAAGRILISVFTSGTWQMRRRAFDRALGECSLRLEKGLATLGTIGSIAPFVGLLGTVLGIIGAFRGLASQSGAGHTAVSAGIAEALVNTAMGLLVAIPAVIAYNYFNTRLNRFSDQVTAAAEETLDALASREDKVNA